MVILNELCPSDVLLFENLQYEREMLKVSLPIFPQCIYRMLVVFEGDEGLPVSNYHFKRPHSFLQKAIDILWRVEGQSAPQHTSLLINYIA